MKRIIFFTLLVLLGFNFAYAQDDTVVCTMDVKQCPDGTWVGRTGPNCEFNCSSHQIDQIEEPPQDEDYSDRDKYPLDLFMMCDNEPKEPVCAIPPMPQCLIDHTCKMPNPAPTTYTNECLAKQAKANILYKGKCDEDIDNIKKEIPDNCITWFDGCNTCTRTKTGMMAMCTMMACKSYSEPYCMKFADDGETTVDVVNDGETNVDVVGGEVSESESSSGYVGSPRDNDLETNNEFRVINKIQTKKFLGLFSVKLNTKLFVDKDTGSLIKEKKPWYSFLLF